MGNSPVPKSRAVRSVHAVYVCLDSSRQSKHGLDSEPEGEKLAGISGTTLSRTNAWVCCASHSNPAGTFHTRTSSPIRPSRRHDKRRLETVLYPQRVPTPPEDAHTVSANPTIYGLS